MTRREGLPPPPPCSSVPPAGAPPHANRDQTLGSDHGGHGRPGQAVDASQWAVGPGIQDAPRNEHSRSHLLTFQERGDRRPTQASRKSPVCLC